jgi:hypothetical protein
MAGCNIDSGYARANDGENTKYDPGIANRQEWSWPDDLLQLGNQLADEPQSPASPAGTD